MSRFTRESFEQIAKSAGLRVVSSSYTQGAPFWTVSVLAWLEERGAIRISIDRPAWMHPLYAPLAAGFAAIDFARGAAAPLSQMTFSPHALELRPRIEQVWARIQANPRCARMDERTPVRRE